MSHYTTIKTQITDKESLLQALAEVGFDSSKVEVHDSPVALHGYMGDQRQQKAEIVIPKRYVGRASNDIGFAQTETGEWEAIISDFDRGIDGHRAYGTAWMNRLTQAYAKAKILKTVQAQGFSISQETTQNGQIHMTLNRIGL